MTAPIPIDQTERDAIRVFAINQPATDVAAALKAQPPADLARHLLNNPHLNTASTEIFPVADLTGMGLGRYLIEGYAVDEAEIAPDHAKLDALEGYVLLLFSDSFAGIDGALTPGPDLTLIGTYTEYRPAQKSAPLRAQSAKPYSGAPGVTAPSPTRGSAGSALVVLAMIALLGLGLWWLLT